jgi:CDP-6-deoxy-D-xylo-4-hexulose-3-dehydrase
MNNFFYPLIDDPFSNDDIKKGIKVLKSRQLTLAGETLNFERSFSKKIDAKYSLMVNSGSSANLLALQCLINPYRKNRLKKNDEVIIPTLCWSTSLWPIVQSNLKPVFIDINKETLNINEVEIEKKITKKTKAILLVHVLGNSCNMDVILRIKKKYNLILIEDTCESLGTKYKNKYLGTFGEFSSFSFYSSHQISSGEGGNDLLQE